GSPSMNFFEGRLVNGDNDTTSVDAASLKLEIPAERADQLKAHVGRDVILGIRPEDIHHVAERGDAPGGQRANVQVEVVEPLGAELIVYLQAGPYEFTSRMDTRNRIN